MLFELVAAAMVGIFGSCVYSMVEQQASRGDFLSASVWRIFFTRWLKSGNNARLNNAQERCVSISPTAAVGTWRRDG
jgi:hypothetical protein